MPLSYYTVGFLRSLSTFHHICVFFCCCSEVCFQICANYSIARTLQRVCEFACVLGLCILGNVQILAAI